MRADGVRFCEVILKSWIMRSGRPTQWLWSQLFLLKSCKPARFPGGRWMSVRTVKFLRRNLSQLAKHLKTSHYNAVLRKFQSILFVLQTYSSASCKQNPSQAVNKSCEGFCLYTLIKQKCNDILLKSIAVTLLKSVKSTLLKSVVLCLCVIRHL